MASSSAWITPLLLLPGAALLVLSTGSRFGQLHEEFHRHKEHGSSQALAHLRRRARLFRSALVSLYVSIALLAISSVIGSLVEASLIASGLTVLAVAIEAFAAVQLIRESTILLSVIEDEDQDNQPH